MPVSVAVPDVADVQRANAGLVTFLRPFFAAKCGQDVAATMRHFSPDRLAYVDAPMGWVLNYEQLEAIYSAFMPTWEEGMAYPTRMVGDEHSAVVFTTVTPELFGGEARCVVALDVRDGRIVRWVDYWDRRSFGLTAAAALAAARPEGVPEPFTAGFAEVDTIATGAVRTVAEDLVRGLGDGDAAAVAALLAADVVVEDLTLRTRVCGRLAVERYLSRVLRALPYGRGARLRHVLGSGPNGGFEWSSAGSDINGITALELDDAALITRLSTMWDGALVDDAALTALVVLTTDPTGA